MNVVKDLQDLIQLMHSREEVIVFPIGGEGQQLLDLLRYTNLLQRVCCIAAMEVAGNNTEQKFIHEIPVIPFENLVHFRETALLIVVAPEQAHENLYTALTSFGFKFIVCIGNKTHVQIRNELQELYSSGQVMMWYMKHFDKKITNLEHRVDEQNEISVVNTKAFSEYRNAFRGKEVVIVGNGSTLNYYKPIPNAIHIGLNRAWLREDIYWDYLFTIDGFASKYFKMPVEQGFDKIRCKIFVGKYLERIAYHWGNYREDVLSLKPNAIKFMINEVSDNVSGQIIHQDICQYPVYTCSSVVSPAFCFSLFTYPDKIYFVGCDTSPTGHFYSESSKNRDDANKFLQNNLPTLKVGYARIKMFAKQYYPNTEIISINPVGLRGLFTDIYTDEYKSALNQKNKI